MGIPVVQLSNVQDVQVIFTALDSPIWRGKLWVNPYVQNLPFMSAADTQYNKFAIVLESVIIDFTEYLQVPNYQVLRDTHLSWMLDPNDGSILYIHFEYHNPPFSFLSFKSGLLIGFSYGKSLVLGDLKTYPLLLDFPTVEDSADNFIYQKMKFATGNITIDNSSGILDELIELFGNDINLLNYTSEGVLEIVRQFFVNSYTLGLRNVKFSVKDKRSRLTFKAPNTFYNLDDYPFIDENDLDKVIQDAYGYCRGVKGTCINRNQVYNPPLYQPASGFNNWFTFKFARKITSIEDVWVNKSDVWTQIFPGLGIPNNQNWTAGQDELLFWQATNPHPIQLIYKDAALNDQYVDITNANKDNLGSLYPTNDGRIRIWWSQALKDNVGFLERRNGNADVVKMTGVFVNFNTPGDIVRDMMTYYGDLPYDESYFNMEDWETEMTGMRQIGICLNKDDNIYNWIEKIQNGSMMGFQLLIYQNLFSARVDNPNRDETFNIRFNEIINRDVLEPEMNGDAYASFTSINWGLDYTDEIWQTVIDKSQRINILDVYKYEKEYSNDSYLVNETDVIQKGRIILENFMQVRPVIRGIELNGLRWDEIRLFSTGWIDFSLKLPQNMKVIQKYMKDRGSMGRMRVKVLGWKRNLKTEKTIIDVIQCDKLESIPDMSIMSVLLQKAFLAYSMDAVPNIPDNTAGQRYRNDASWTGWAAVGSGPISVSNGIMTIENKEPLGTYFRREGFNWSAGDFAIIRMRLISGNPNVLTNFNQIDVNNDTAQTSTIINSDWSTVIFKLTTTVVNGFINLFAWDRSTLPYKYEVSDFYIGNASYSSQLFDDSGHGRSSALAGGVVSSIGKINNGLRFFLSQITLPTGFNVSESFTWAFWMNIPLTGLDQFILSNYTSSNGVSLVYRAAGLLGFIYIDPVTMNQDSGYLVLSDITNNEWMHIIFKYDANSKTVFLKVNNVVKLTKIINPIIMPDSSNPFIFGGLSTVDARKCEGLFDELVILPSFTNEGEDAALFTKGIK